MSVEFYILTLNPNYYFIYISFRGMEIFIYLIFFTLFSKFIVIWYLFRFTCIIWFMKGRTYYIFARMRKKNWCGFTVIACIRTKFTHKLCFSSSSSFDFFLLHNFFFYCWFNISKAKMAIAWIAHKIPTSFFLSIFLYTLAKF